MKNLTIEELWTAACSGDIETLSDYYSNGFERRRRYHKFGKDHSLIAGAYRNNQMETVDFLLDNGETILDHERTELKEIYYRSVIVAASALTSYMRYHNKNLTGKQEALVDDLWCALRELKKEG